MNGAEAGSAHGYGPSALGRTGRYRSLSAYTKTAVIPRCSTSSISPLPEDHQRENWLLAPHIRWKKIGTIAWSALSEFEDRDEPLWTAHTYYGRTDRIPWTAIDKVTDSLRFIHVGSLRLSVGLNEAYSRPKRQVRGRFSFGGVDYTLGVTDPRYKQTYLARPDGDYEIGDSFLTISLGEPYKDFCYKLIAAIIQRYEKGT